MTENFTPGINDEKFIRGQVPMTKEEVRTLSICKLHLTPSSVLYDIGSGTGSVAIEAAMLSEKINVYALEVNQQALALIQKNKEQFAVQNLHVVEALAPNKIDLLPQPTHAFIGGTKGNLREILSALYKKNSRMRIVMNAVSLETVSEMTQVLKEFVITNQEVIQVSISKAKYVGDYHLMEANNSVYIFSFEFNGDCA